MRVLKPGGTLVVATWCQRESPPAITPSEQKELNFCKLTHRHLPLELSEETDIVVCLHPKSSTCTPLDSPFQKLSAIESMEASLLLLEFSPKGENLHKAFSTYTKLYVCREAFSEPLQICCASCVELVHPPFSVDFRICGMFGA